MRRGDAAWRRDLADWLGLILTVLGDLSRQGECFVLVSLPIVGCKRAPAPRSRPLRTHVVQSFATGRLPG